MPLFERPARFESATNRKFGRKETSDERNLLCKLDVRDDLLTLFYLLQQKKIKPLIAQRLPLGQAQHAHELLGRGSVIGKIVLMPNGPS